MTDHDPLKTLLMEATPHAPHANDLGFALEVMKRVEKRRLIDGLLALSAFVATLSAVLFAVMPYLTPVVNDLSRLLAPALGVMVLVGLSLLALEPVRRMLRI